jgi:hypothetical protein
MFRGYGGIVVLAALYFIAAKIGDTFSKTLMIFSIFIWAIAAALFAYLILFRGMKLSFFCFGAEKQPIVQDDFEQIDDVDVDGTRELGDHPTPPAAS